MRNSLLVIGGTILLVACNSDIGGKSNLAEKIACSQYVDGKYENEVTETYMKSYDFFYSEALDTCIAEMFESLYQPGHKDYFMRLALIDVVSKHFLIDFNDPGLPTNLFYISREEYEDYRKLVREGTSQELEKYKESRTKDFMKEVQN